MDIRVALDGARRRDLFLGQGDEVTLVPVIYAHDGDTEQVAFANAQIITPDGESVFALGVPFVVSESLDRKSVV
jgi:hypothetical protein